MKIVVLDGYTLNPGDNPWQPFQALGDVTVYDETAPHELHERAKDAQVLITNKVRFSAEIMDALPALRYIGVLATGYDIIDTAAAAARGIVVTNVPNYSTDSVAEQVFALLLGMFRRVESHSDGVHAGKWTAGSWCYWESTQLELAGNTMGIIGFGNTGRRVAEVAQAFKMPVLAYAPRPKEGLYDAPDAPFEFVGLDELFARADIVSLHCPLRPDTRNIVNAERLGAMRKGAYLVNVGRGGLADEAAVAKALYDGHLAGAGFDVISAEPIQKDNPLLGAPNCLITPHVAWATLSARKRLMAIAAANVRAFQEGRAENVVNSAGPGN